MRKALIGLILAATVLTPLAAQAQDRGGRNRHEQREDNSGSGGEAAQQRQEYRQQRQEYRQQRQQRQVQVEQPQQQVQVAQRERRGGGWRGNDGYRGGDRGSWRGSDGDRGGDRGGWRGNDGDRGGWRGGDRGQTGTSTVQGWGGPNTPEYREHAERYNRRAQENALRYGTQEQRREVYRQRRGDRDGDWRDGRDGNWRDGRDGNWRGDRDRNWRDGRRGDWRNSWNRGWRYDRRYDWNRWRYSNRNIFRVPPYYSPYRNHRYSRFSIGLFLDSLFYDQRYWIGDPWQYRLPPAPPGTQWVRYYNDVILVDVYSGEVIDVIYDFFW